MRSNWITLAATATLLFAGMGPCNAAADNSDDSVVPYRYTLHFDAGDRRHVEVDAEVTLKNGTLMMAPWGYATSLENGWASFVEDLQVTRDGHAIPVTVEAPGQWKIDAPDGTRLSLHYAVNLTHDQVDWDSAGGIDARPALQADTVTWITKALIIFSDNDDAAASVEFDLPVGWGAAAPWRAVPGKPFHWRPDNLYQAYDNAIVVGDVRQREIVDGSMRVTLVMTPELADSMPMFERALGEDLAEYRRILGSTPDAHYLIALRQDVVDDGEAFGSSFVQVFKRNDLALRTIVWSRLFAHELFHYWNGGRLNSTDDASTEWFKEGVTEYIASRTVMRNGQIGQRDWEQMLGTYMGRYFSSRFMQPGDKPSLQLAGKNKGGNWRLVYGGGATIGLLMDIKLRDDTDNRKSLDDVLKLLDQRHGATGTLFTKEQLLATFNEVGGKDYSAFFADAVAGNGSLPPIAEILTKAGWYLNNVVDEYYLSPLPGADRKALAIRKGLMQGSTDPNQTRP